MTNQGWRTVTLRDLIGDKGLLVDGDWVESKDQDPNGDVRLIQLADVGDGVYLNRSARFLTSEKAKQLKCTYLEQGDILIARMPDPLGRACIFPQETMPCVTVVDVCILRPDKKLVDINWLAHIINSPDFRNSLNKFIFGTTRSRISRKNLEKISLEVPPLPEQKRIAEVLDKVSALQEKRRLALQKLDTLRQSVFLEMFGDPLKNPKGWKETAISEICFVKGGKRLPKGENYSPTPTNFRYIRVTDIKNGRIAEKQLHYLYPETQSKIRRYIVNEGDVVISIAGSIGLIAPVPKTLNGVNLTENAAKLCPRKLNEYNSTFLSNILKSDYAQQQIGQHTGQVTIGKLALFRIERIKIPLPPIELQNEFKAFMKKFETYRDRLDKSLKMSENLFQSLQQRVFKGELFSNECPSVEPQEGNVWQQTSLF